MNYLNYACYKPEVSLADIIEDDSVSIVDITEDDDEAPCITPSYPRGARCYEFRTHKQRHPKAIEEENEVKARNVLIFEKRLKQGRDIWTGELLEASDKKSIKDIKKWKPKRSTSGQNHLKQNFEQEKIVNDDC